MRTSHISCLSLALSLGLAPLAAAQSTAQAGTTPEYDAPIVTLQAENDAVSSFRGTSDQYYTSGLRLGYVSSFADAASFRGFADTVFGAGDTRYSFDLSQDIYTPRNTQLALPTPRDRPYAGVLLASFGLVHDTANARDQIAVAAGVAGPAAEGEEIQNGFHSLIGDPSNKGWHYQEPNQPAVNFYGSHTWRVSLGDIYGLESEMLPAIGASLGDVRTALQAGGLFRIGQGLGADFGPSRIETGPAGPALSGGDAFVTVAPLSWSVFAGADGQAVAYDYAIDGAAFQHNTPMVHRLWDQGGIIAGTEMLWHGVRLSYTQSWRTQETLHAKSGLFNFGSLAAAVRF
jgi:hypothetical protein